MSGYKALQPHCRLCWPCPRASSGRLTDRHGAGSGRFRKYLSACTVSRPWSLPRRLGPPVRAAWEEVSEEDRDSPGHAMPRTLLHGRRYTLATTSAVGAARLRRSHPWASLRAWSSVQPFVQFFRPGVCPMTIGPCPPVQELPGFSGIDFVPRHGQEAVVHLPVDVARAAAPPSRELASGHEQFFGIFHVSTSMSLGCSVSSARAHNTLITASFSRMNTYHQ